MGLLNLKQIYPIALEKKIQSDRGRLDDFIECYYNVVSSKIVKIPSFVKMSLLLSDKLFTAKKIL